MKTRQIAHMNIPTIDIIKGMEGEKKEMKIIIWNYCCPVNIFDSIEKS